VIENQVFIGGDGDSGNEEVTWSQITKPTLVFVSWPEIALLLFRIIIIIIVIIIVQHSHALQKISPF
jgi:hypothetical protein